MATKNYMINDKWLDLDKQNIVELQSVDGVLDSMKVNGSEIVTPSGKITITENGTDINIAQYALANVNVEGGSSDFSTAEVEIRTGNTTGIFIPVAVVDDFDGGDGQLRVYSIPPNTASSIYKIPLYKGLCYFSLFDVAVVVTGDIEAEGEDYDEYDIYIRGNGTITITAE